MITVNVRTFDVWGHSPDNCKDYDCPCMVEGEHDDDRCDCDYTINDSFAAGSIEAKNLADESLFDALKVSYLADHVKLDDVNFDEAGDSACNVLYKGRPLFGLEWVQPNA